MLVSTRDDLTETVETCKTHDFTLSIHSIRDFDGEATSYGSARFGLMADQHEALALAYKQGYFAVPAEAGLQDLADEIGISHQALSERLRRGHETFIQEMLLDGSNLVIAEQQPATDADDSDDEDVPPVGD